MKSNPAEITTNQAHARSLLDNIHGVPDIAFPRRDTIVEWLKAYLGETQRKGHVETQEETENLAALERFLRVQKVPAAPISPL